MLWPQARVIQELASNSNLHSLAHNAADKEIQDFQMLSKVFSLSDSLIYSLLSCIYLRKSVQHFFNNENPFICDLLYKQEIIF